jgi:pSer/pThr/pTyr-binding forkhead associated (FHA) protein
VKLVLVRFKEDGTRREFVAPDATLRIGREPSCQLRVPSNNVSRQHCEITIEDGKATLCDLNSRNGTYRNEQRIEEPQILEPGDRIAIGSIVFTVQIDGEPSHVEPPLLDAPTAVATPKKSKAKPASASNSDSDLSDLIAEMSGDDSSVFEFDLDDSDT